MTKTVAAVFDFVPTANPDEVIEHSRHVINASHGIGMDLLKEIVTEHIPCDDSSSGKKIIRTKRYECPCCATSLTALVESCGDLYRVSLRSPYDNGKNGLVITIEKLVAEWPIYKHSSKTPFPKKNYKRNEKKG